MATKKDDYRKERKTYKDKGVEFLYTEWQHRAVYYLRELINSGDPFMQDIQKVRADKDLSDVDKTYTIIAKYALPDSMAELLRHYILHDKINSFVMKPPVIAVSTKENIAGPSIAHNNGKSLKAMLDRAMKQVPDQWVYLVIDPDCTKTDFKEWIETYWDRYLQARLDALKPRKFKRVKISSYIKRNYEIYQHIVIDGLPAKDIAKKWNITPEYARKIALQIKKKTHTA